MELVESVFLVGSLFSGSLLLLGCLGIVERYVNLLGFRLGNLGYGA